MDEFGRVGDWGEVFTRGLAQPAEAVATLSNDALIVRLHFTVNHLSRWLSPVHNQRRLDRSPRRSEPAVTELVGRLRDEEVVVYPWLHAIAHQSMPDLDAMMVATEIDGPRRSATDSTMQFVAEFRRLRQSTSSLLRSLPDSAWNRRGLSRRGGDRSLRGLAEHLVEHDRLVLDRLDRALDQVGVRDEVATVSRADSAELLRLAPARVR